MAHQGTTPEGGEETPDRPEDYISLIPDLYLGDFNSDLSLDLRDEATDYSYKIDQRSLRPFAPNAEVTRDQLLRKELKELEARRASLSYGKSRKPAVRERVAKIRKDVDRRIAEVSKELMTYDLMAKV